MSKKLILQVMIFGLFLGTASVAFAQNIPVPYDTMKVMDSAGRPGDTITVNLYVENSEVILQGLSANLFFDRTVLTYINGSLQPVGRNGDTLDTPTGMIFRDSLLVVNLVSWHADWPGHILHYGRGVVGKMRFRISPSAQYGARTYLRFGDNGTQSFNGWADTSSAGGLFIPSMVDGFITVTGGTFNQPPVIGAIGTQEVREGQTLQFTVSAYDLDGDPITISAQGLPPNAYFPAVQGDSIASGMFTFTPTFEQGPDTVYVTFVASDDHNNTTNLTVPIIIIATPNDYLSIDSQQGGVCGATGRDVNVELTNARNIYGVQFNYHYDTDQIDVMDILQTERTAGLGFYPSEPTPGNIIVLIFSYAPGADIIEPGSGAIVQMMTNVSTEALIGPTPIVLDSAYEVIDSIGTTRSLVMNDGYFTVDRFGDANLDGLVNVGDCVTIIVYIIEQYTLNVRQFDAADVNRDARVTVTDLQNVIDIILRIPTEPAPLPPTPLVFAQLKRDTPASGDVISIPLWVDIGTQAAAVQYEVDYNADRLEPLDVTPGPMVQGLRLDHNEADGKAKGVVYNLSGMTFGPSSGELVTLNFRLKFGEFGPRDVAFKEFLIVNRGAALIPSEIQGELPSRYSLSQNYPNPFNSSTRISFDLYEDALVELTVYDLLGRKVSTLVDQYLTVGNHDVTWNGRSDKGENMASGVYFYRLQAGEFSETKRMLLMK
jgi:hypothetical protein